VVIKVDGPQIQILLFKMTGINFVTGSVYRGRAGGLDTIDLAPLLGDAGSVRTIKAIDEPCGGFSITFADRINDENGDTVFALAEPMDMVEIRMARIPVGRGGTAPLVMRGFISNIRRVETIAGDGTPQRVVVMQGQDMAKLWQIHNILPEAQMAMDLSALLSTFRMFAATGIAVGLVTAAEFVQRFTDEIMNARVADFSAVSGWAIPPFATEISVPPSDGWISASLMEAFPGGKYWDVLEFMADRPWNELWVRDDEAGPTLVYRPVPYFDIGGGIIMPGGAAPDIITWDIGDIVSLDNARTDHRTANFFWVEPGTSIPETAGRSAINNAFRIAGGVGGPLFALDHENCLMQIYGLRKMQHDSRRIANDIPEPLPANLNSPPNRILAGDRQTEFNIRRAELLKLLNWDNVVWTSTEMVCKGHEVLQAGKTLEWTRGQFRGSGMTYSGYVTRVAHTWVPLKSGNGAGWTTTLNIERGTEFLVRDSAGGSPFWQEGRRGPYSPNS
jgi:hypothetical protein